MKKIVFKKFFRDTSIFFILITISITFIVWVIQAVNFLDFVTEDGHSFKIYYYYSYKWNPVLNRICLKKFKIFKKFLTSINESNTVLKARVEVTSTEFRGGEGYLFFLSNFWFHLVSFYPLLSHTESRSCVFWKVCRSWVDIIGH